MKLLPFIRSTARHVGVSISDGSIELVEIASTGNGSAPVVLCAWAVRPLEAGIVEGGRVLDVDRLAGVLQDALKKAIPGPVESRRLHLVLPDSVTYFHVFHFPGMLTNLEVQNALQFEAAEVIPFPAEDLFGDFLVLDRTAQQTTVLYAVAFKETVRAFEKVCEKVGCSLGGIGLEAEALDRALLGEARAGKASVVVDVGQFTSTVFVEDTLGLRGTFSVPIAGEDFTKALAMAKKIKPDAAEALKRSVGIGTKSDKVTKATLQARIVALVDRVVEVIQWYRELETGFVIDEVVLTGGSSEMQGMEAVFTSALEEKTDAIVLRRVNPLVRVSDGDVAQKARKQSVGSVLAPALGMALLVSQGDRPFLQFASDGGSHTVSGGWWSQLSTSPAWKQATWRERLQLVPESVKLIVAGVFLVSAVAVLAVTWFGRQEKLDDAAHEEAALAYVDVPADESLQNLRVSLVATGGSNEIIGRLHVVNGVRLTTAVTPANAQPQPARATGEVTIYNNDTTVHVLIASTRLQSETGVIFRIQESISLESGTSIRVSVVADEPGVQGNIVPGRLLLPGLSASLQEVVYARSDLPFTTGEQLVGTWTEADIDMAKIGIQTQVTSQIDGLLQLEQLVGEQAVPGAFRFDVDSIVSSVPVGTEASTVSVEATGTLTVLLYQIAELGPLADKKFELDAVAEDLSWADLHAVDNAEAEL